MNGSDIIKENEKRIATIYAKFNPITGEGSVGQRKKIEISDFPLRYQWLPSEMLHVPLVKKIIKAGTVSRFLTDCLKVEDNEEECSKVIDQFIRLRHRFDFPFWAATEAYIKRKGGGEDVLFRLTFPQRKLVATLEDLRLSSTPIRIVLLKARQWGGSTAIQLYMAWLQLVHEKGLNSLIIAHQGAGSDEINDMFTRLMEHYPTSLLYSIGEAYDLNEPKLVNVGKSGNIRRVPQRNCKIKIGTAERPDSCRGGDYNLVHLSEVGLWKATEGKKPEDIVRSACSGVLFKPYTMIVYESTANGSGNFFHREFVDARNGDSQFHPFFISWFDIEAYSIPFQDKKEEMEFAEWLYNNKENKNVTSSREEPGVYLWWLWTIGATLEGIKWYIEERKKYTDHGQMASEYPSDSVEAFVNSGQRVFDKYLVDKLASSCRPPKCIGEVYAKGDEGKSALQNLRFSEDRQGQLWVWNLPDIWQGEKCLDRYLVVVDIGGRSGKADWSVIVVFDRLPMIENDRPVVVAQWYGHIDMDILAWRAAQIAAFYDNALLVIESNTLETHDRERQVDGDQSLYILNQIKDVYPNLYARKQSDEDIREGRPKKYGFHTNTATKPKIISTLVKVIREHLYTERDKRCIFEYLNYERKPNGSYGAITGEHDDLLMTRAIGLHICFYEMDYPRIVARKQFTNVPRKKAISAATI